MYFQISAMVSWFCGVFDINFDGSLHVNVCVYVWNVCSFASNWFLIFCCFYRLGLFFVSVFFFRSRNPKIALLSTIVRCRRHFALRCFPKLEYWVVKTLSMYLRFMNSMWMKLRHAYSFLQHDESVQSHTHCIFTITGSIANLKPINGHTQLICW